MFCSTIRHQKVIAAQHVSYINKGNTLQMVRLNKFKLSQKANIRISFSNFFFFFTCFVFFPQINMRRNDWPRQSL